MLIEAYAAAAIAQQEALEKANSQTANKHYKMRASIYRELRSRGSEAQSHFLNLLKHTHVCVRGSAASNALEFAPDKAIPILEELAKGQPGFWKADAKMVLQQWEKGALKFP